MDNSNYKIGEVASKLDTSIRSIRYYEEEGLVIPHRTEGGTRFYSTKHITRLMVILRLTQIGFSLDAIRKIIAVREDCKTGDEGSIRVDLSLQEVSNTINTQIQELEKINNEIRDAREIIGKCKGCSNQPSSLGCPHCPVKSKLNEIELLNLVWDTE